MDKQRSLRRLTPLIMGGAGFSYQLTAAPESIPVVEIIKRAFESGIKAIDTSPYYEPSEQLIGKALNHPEIKSRYSRSSYNILTKVGRVTATHLDYSPSAIRHSVARSLERFNTTYLDVVFAHDVELVSLEEAITAVGVLFEIAQTGRIHHVGISGYDIDVLSNIAFIARERFGQPIDVVQSWAQLTLQNTQLERRGFCRFRDSGVTLVCCSSPLAVGLLRSAGVPVGNLGNWHPAPEGLRVQVQRAAGWVEKRNENLALLALRYAVGRAQRNSSPDLLVTTICGIGSISDLEQNVSAVNRALGLEDLNLYDRKRPNGHVSESRAILDHESEEKDAILCQKVKEILGDWVDYDFSTKKKALLEKKDVHSSNENTVLEDRISSRL